MLNLLQQEQKQALIKEYRTRFFVIALALFLSIEVIAAITLVPSYLASVTRVKALDIQTAQYNAGNSAEEITKLNDTLKKTNDMVNIISATSTPKDAVGSLIAILENRTDGITLNGVVYHAEQGLRHFTLQGKSTTREGLVNFQKKISQLPKIVTIDLPVSNFAQAQNITFTMSIVQSL